MNRTFESPFLLCSFYRVLIVLRVKLTPRACEHVQVPFNVWVYLSVQYKFQEK